MNKIAKFFRDAGTARFFIPLGIILLIVCVFQYLTIERSKDFIETESVVTKTELVQDEYYDGENHHDAIYKIFVKYTVDGKEYEVEYSELPNIKVGDKIKIAYNPADPTDIVQASSMLWVAVFGLGGIASLIFSAYSIVKVVKKNKKLKLQEEGWAKNGN